MYRTAIIVFALVAMTGCTEDRYAHSVSLGFSTPPPSSPAAGTVFEVVWEVSNGTGEDLHHTELRVCDGADVDNCGIGDSSTYVAVRWRSDFADAYELTMLFISPGPRTVVAWASVGDYEYVSTAYTVNVQ